jgi:carbon monoxide dehydrogenase subunit G
MVEVHRVFTVHRPVEVVSEYLRDFAHAEAWDPGTVSCIRLDSGPVRVGSEWHNVSEFRGKKTELAYRLTRMETGRLIFVGENKTATSTDDLTLTAIPEGTRITYRATIIFNGLAKLAGPFLKREFEKLGDQIVVTMPRTLTGMDSGPQLPS